jgi:AcrR family transcriptional regulator
MSMASNAPRDTRRKTTPAEAAGRGDSRNSARRELVEHEIFEQATQLFAERGFAGTSLQDVADAMGMSRPSLYYYVKSKDALLAKLVTEITEGPAAEMDAIAERANLDPIGKLRAIARLIAVRRATQPARFRLLVRSEAELPPELAAAHKAGRKAVLNSLTAVIDEGIVAGQLRPVDPRVAALGVLGLCNWVAWWFHPHGRDSVDGIADQLTDMAIAALSRAPSRGLDSEGPTAVVALLRQDLDHLERLLRD